MALVPANFIAGWPGSSAIPAGWERATELDDVHLKGAAAGADPGTSGGALSHQHASPHVHTGAAHTHGGATFLSAPTLANYWLSGITSGVAAAAHGHTGPTTGSGTSSLTASSTSPWGTSPNDPSYTTVRFIRSLGTTTGIPVGAWVWWDAAALPSSWSSPAAARGVFLKGAAAGANGGGTGGSLAAHSHLGQAHGHPIADHAHTGGTSGDGTLGPDVTTGTPGSSSGKTHTHPVTIAAPAAGPSGNGTSANTGSTTTNGPAFTTLGVIQNDNAGLSFPVGIIGAWDAILASLPGSLRVCDGGGGTFDTRGKFIKGATLSGSNFTGLGTTGGSDTHDHTDPAGHTHSLAHQHMASLGAPSGVHPGVAPGSITGLGYPHAHPSALTGASAGTSGSGVATVDVADHQPPSLTTVFVKYLGAVDVTITNPTADQEITGPSISFAWTLSAGTQVSERVRIYANDLATLLFDSGVIADTSTGYAYAGSQLRTGNDYYAVISIVNNSGVPGDAVVHFSTLWEAPDAPTGLTYAPQGGV